MDCTISAHIASFTTQADFSLAIEDTRQNRANEKTFRAFLRASQTLDVSATPEGDSWFVRNRCIAQLQELLACIELPSVNKIPGTRAPLLTRYGG